MGLISAKAITTQSLLKDHFFAVGVEGTSIETEIENIYQIKNNITIRGCWSTVSPLPPLIDLSTCDVILKFRTDGCHPLTDDFLNQLRILISIREDILSFKKSEDSDIIREPVYRCGIGIEISEVRENINKAMLEMAEILPTHSTECDIEDVIQNAKLRRFNDLTDNLWEILKRCSSYKYLKLAFNVLFQSAARSNIVEGLSFRIRLSETMTKLLLLTLCAIFEQFRTIPLPLTDIDDNIVEIDSVHYLEEPENLRYIIDLSFFGTNIYGVPDEATAQLVANYSATESSVNPEELGSNLEGDILMPEDQLLTKNGIFAPNGVVPFEIGSNYNARELSVIEHALEQFHSYTCVRFVPRTGQDNDYVSIANGNSGCWSTVGRTGGRQEVNLQSPGCLLKSGAAIHELMHALGFLHEQNRQERDDCHTRPLADVMGQRNSFSAFDIEKLNKMYDCGYLSPPPVSGPDAVSNGIESNVVNSFVGGFLTGLALAEEKVDVSIKRVISRG
uniref:Multifunctional fusion protein n=1 Tax=Glossina pallidipes TaxID=7398 RepID=A0A1A9ZHJ3_GLOPL